MSDLNIVEGDLDNLVGDALFMGDREKHDLSEALFLSHTRDFFIRFMGAMGLYTTKVRETVEFSDYVNSKGDPLHPAYVQFLNGPEIDALNQDNGIDKICVTMSNDSVSNTNALIEASSDYRAIYTAQNVKIPMFSGFDAAERINDNHFAFIYSSIIIPTLDAVKKGKGYMPMFSKHLIKRYLRNFDFEKEIDLIHEEMKKGGSADKGALRALALVMHAQIRKEYRILGEAMDEVQLRFGIYEEAVRYKK